MADVRPASNLSPSEIAMRLLREAVPARWKLYALSLVCMVGVAGFTAAFAWSTKLIVNDVFVAGDAVAAYGIAALVVGLALAKAGSDYANAVVGVVFARSVSAATQKRVFAAFLDKDVWHFLGTPAAKHMADVKLYGQAAGKVVVGLANRLLTDGLTVIALLAVMIWQDPLMSLVSLILFPAIFLLISTLSRRIKSVARVEKELTGTLQALGTESFDGVRTIKSYGLEEKSKARFNAAVDALEERILSIAKATSATMPAMEVMGGLVLGGFVVYAAWQTITVGQSPGEFTAFITAFLLAYQPAERVSKLWVDVQKSLAHVQQMYEILEAPPRRPQGGNAELAGQPSITFDAVSFAYSENAPALHDVSLDIRAGERIAIVGGSGAGKTTLIDLVQRFYDPTAGTIRIGGQDLRDLSEPAMRNAIALIAQDVFLFEGTVRENVRDGRPDAEDAAVIEAVRRAALDDVLAADGGIDAQVGPGGAFLSGGQRQRVGIARALLRGARVLIFDEATSALDAANERRIMENLIATQSGATLLFVTHRAATLAYVDRVLFLQEGRLAGFDRHAALSRSNAAYRTLFNLDKTADAAE
ncbi:MAG: ABC transporter ATP-binding protein [Pseudomonadota bacterium]